MIGRRNTRRNIVVCGFHCCWASDTANEVARRLKRRVISIANEIQRREALSVHAITGLGKPAIPGRMEELVIRDITYRENLVAALEPPVEFNAHAHAELREHSYTVFLDAPFAVLWERMLRDPGLSDMVLELGRHGVYDLWLQQRRHFEQCDLQVFTAQDASQLGKLIVHCFLT